MDETVTFTRLRESGVVAVLIIDAVEDAVPVAEALLMGGVRAMELTLRTPAALKGLEAIRTKVPQMLAGVGTIIRPDQVDAVLDVGGMFGVSPGMSPAVVQRALASGLPFAPGICTPSDIERALEFDRKLLKFFPAETSGGLKYLQNIGAPYQHLGLGYVPLGGLTLLNMGTYLQSPLIAAIGGSWLAPRELIKEGKWEAIQEAAEAATQALQDARLLTAGGRPNELPSTPQR